MIETPELTVSDYLRQLSPQEQSGDKALGIHMCELLTARFNVTSCEGGVATYEQLCDIETSTTYTKHDLDWAYRQAQETMTH